MLLTTAFHRVVLLLDLPHISSPSFIQFSILVPKEKVIQMSLEDKVAHAKGGSSNPPAWQLLMQEQLEASSDPSLRRFNSIREMARERRASVNRRMQKSFAAIVDRDINKAVARMNRKGVHGDQKQTVLKVLETRGITTRMPSSQRPSLFVDDEEKQKQMAAVPYTKQGNEELYSHEAMEARKALKYSPAIINALDS